MIITLDSNILSDIAAKLAAARDKIIESDAILGRIPEHGDWGCAEREMLYEEICAVRQASRELTESAEELSGKVDVVLEDLRIHEDAAAAKENELAELVAALAAFDAGAE